MLCERGIRTFETATRNTCDIAAIAVFLAADESRMLTGTSARTVSPVSTGSPR